MVSIIYCKRVYVDAFILYGAMPALMPHSRPEKGGRGGRGLSRVTLKVIRGLMVPDSILKARYKSTSQF